jgi:hypothetical protein
MEKYIQNRWILKASRTSYTHMRKSTPPGKSSKRGKEVHLILIKRRVHQEAITIVNMYATNIGTPNLTKQKFLFKNKN